MDLAERVLGPFSSVSVCWRVFAACVNVSALSGLKVHSRTLLAYQLGEEVTGYPLPLSPHQHLAENGPIVLNGRKRAFMEQTFVSARAGPLL